MNDQNYTPETIDSVNATPEIPMQENGKPLKKRKYLFTAAPQKTRIMSFVALGLSALFLLLVVIGAIISLNVPLWEVPMFAMVVGDKTMDNLEDSCDEALDLVKEAQRDDDEAAIENLEDRFDTDIKSLKKALENPSLMNMSKIAVGMGEKEGAAAYGIIIGLIIGFAAFVLLFAGLATLLLNKGLLITAYIFAIPFYLLFTGAGLLVAATVVLIAYIVAQSMANADYKKYKKSFAK